MSTLSFDKISHPDLSILRVLLRAFQNTLENTCAGVSFFLSKCRLKACSFIKKRLRFRSFSVNFVKFLRTPANSCFSFDIILPKCKRIKYLSNEFISTSKLHLRILIIFIDYSLNNMIGLTWMPYKIFKYNSHSSQLHSLKMANYIVLESRILNKFIDKKDNEKSHQFF